MPPKFLTRLISAILHGNNSLIFRTSRPKEGMNSSPLKTVAAVTSSPQRLSTATGSPTKRQILSQDSVSSPKKALFKMSQTENAPLGVLKELSGNKFSTTAETVDTKNDNDKKTQLLFKKLSEHAFQPTKGSKLAAGFDLKSAYEYTVPKRGSCLIKTDIQIQLPHGTYGRVAPRSGLALKNQIDVGAGVIDEDYRGNVGVILFNHADEDFKVAVGDRIAQLICEKICYPEIMEVESLENSDRGADGFGSTGVKSV